MRAPTSYTDMVLIIASVAVAVMATGGRDRSTDLTQIRLIVVAPAATMQSFIQETLEEARAVWRPLGVEIVWDRTDLLGPRDTAPDVTVTLEEGPVRSPDGVATLGWIRFEGPTSP